MKKYPSLSINYDDKYVFIEEKKHIEVILNLSANAKINITNEVDIYSLEDNLNIEVSDDKYFLSFDSKGVSTVYFTYVYDDKKLFQEIEFVVYDSFFKDNYKLHLIPEIDKINIESNVPLEVLFDTLFEFVDIIDGYTSDIQEIKNPLRTKSKYLKSLFTEKGFQFTDYQDEFTKADLITYKIYKNLLNNLEKIIDIRGTETAYELFFGILGYNVEIFEYWFNEDGNLIELNKTFPEQSTFDLYDTIGQKISDDTYKKIDPRFYISANNPKYIFNKSNYIRIKYYKNVNLPEVFVKSKGLINSYLEWLKPRHVTYLTEVFQLDIIDGEEINFNFLDKFDTSSFVSEIVPPEITPFERKFTSISGRIKIKQGAIFTEFPITTFGKIIFKGSALVASDNYSFASEEGFIKLTGTYSYNEYISSGFIKLKNKATYSIQNPFFTTTGPLINWINFLTPENKDNWEVGYVRGNLSPAEFFAMDFSLTDKNKTYSENLNITKEISLMDEIKETSRFDQEGIHWDINLIFDESVFFLEDIGTEDNKIFSKRFTSNDINMLKNNYVIYKTNNEQLINESNQVYETRIKKMLIKDFYPDFFISLEVINNLLK